MAKSEIPYEDLLAYAADELDPAAAADIHTYLENHPKAALTVARYQALRSLFEDGDWQGPRKSISERIRHLFSGPERRAWHFSISRFVGGSDTGLVRFVRVRS